MKAVNIKWDTDGDLEWLYTLPKELKIPDGMVDEDEISEWLSDQEGFCHNGFEIVKELSQNYIDILEENDWSICSYTGDGRVELEKYSPLEEDFIMCVNVVNFPDSVREYANDFDPDEHASMWISARGIANGVPESIKDLIEDAYAIKQMIYELADALEGKEKPDTPEYYNTFKLSQKIFDALSDEYNDEEGKEQAETDLYNELSQIPGNSAIRIALYRLCERIEELEE